MSVFNFKGYLAPPRQSLGGELIGFNKKTGQPVEAAAGVGKIVGFNRRTGAPVRAMAGPDGIGSYSDMSPDYYKTYQHDNWQHPGSSGWSSANMPGWGNNPNLQMFARRGVGALGAQDCHVQMPGGSGVVPCQPGMDLPECEGCFDEVVEEGFFSRHDIWPQVISATLIAVISGVVLVQLSKRGVET